MSTLALALGLAAPGLLAQERFLGQALDAPDEHAGLPVIADFDGDGLLDLATGVSSPSGSVLRLLAGDGQGWVEPAQDVALPLEYADVWAAGDFDRDGDLDLVGRGSSVATVDLNDGAGHFTAGGNFALAGSYFGPLKSTDLDGDGVPDVVALHDFPGVASVLLGDGAGGFGAASMLVLGGQVDDFDLGDVSGEGNPDLVVPDPDSLSVHVYAGDGAGGFHAQYPVNASIKTRTVALGDVSGDGVLDVVAGRAFTDDGRIAVLRNDGTGLFGPPLVFATDSAVAGLLVTDLDHDGLGDIVAALELLHPGIALFRSTAGGTAFPLVGTQITGHNPSGVRIADLDGDGHAEALCSTEGSLDLFHGATDGLFVQPDPVAAHAFERCLLIADLTGDGLPDVLAGSGDSGAFESFVTIFPGDGHGAFAAPLELPHGDGPHDLATADFDGDGRPEIVVANEFSHDLSLLHSDGTNWSSAMPGGWPWFKWNQAPLSVQTGDLDSDGRPDILAAKFKTSEVSVVLAAGPMSFNAPADEVVAYPGALLQAIEGDFDDDGDLDAAFADEAFNGRVAVMLNDGSGALATVSSVQTIVSGSLPLAADDFDLDGHLDVVTGADDVLLGDGTGSLHSTGAPLLTSGTSTIATADLDGDGFADVIGSESTGRIVIHRGDGQGGLTAWLSVLSATSGWSCACGDLDGDQRPDLVGAGGEPRLTIHLNRATSFPWTSLGGALPGSYGTPMLNGHGALVADTFAELDIDAAPPDAALALVIGLTLIDAPFKGGVLLPHPDLILAGLQADADGFLAVAARWPAGLPSGFAVHFQGWIMDAGTPHGWSATNGMTATTR